MNKIKESPIDSFQVYEVDIIDSTNTFFKLNYNSYQDQSVLIALKQTKGRGRYNREWISDKDICFSILFKKRHNNAIIAPLAIVRTLKLYGIKAGIKWPNDIYYEDKKLCGILIEDVYEGKFQASIVGIGLNRTKKEEVRSSFLDLNLNNRDIIFDILKNYKSLLESDFNEIIKEYQENSIIIGKKIMYHGEEYIAKRIDEEGLLILSNPLNEITIGTDEIDIKSSLKKEA